MITVHSTMEDVTEQIRSDYHQVMRKARKVNVGSMAKVYELNRLMKNAKLTGETQFCKPRSMKTLNGNNWRYRMVVNDYPSLGRQIAAFCVYCFIGTWRGRDIITPTIRTYGKKRVDGIFWYKHHFFDQWNSRFHTELDATEIMDKMKTEFMAPKWEILDSERNGHKEFIIYIRDCMGFGEYIPSDDFFIFQVNTIIPTDQMGYYKKMLTKDLREYGDGLDNDMVRLQIEMMRLKRSIGLLSDEDLEEESKRQLKYGTK